MQKKSESRTRRVLRSIVNIRAWADWDRMKGFTLYLVNGFKKFFIPQPHRSNADETFKSAMNRLKLTEADLLAKQTGLWRLSILMICMAVFLCAYGIYNLVMWHFLAFIISWVVMGVALTFAFRYHFWYYQIKTRRLGCSLHEWFTKGVMGGKR